MLWETWKKGFDAWESATAKYLENVLKSPLVLKSSGSMLTATMKTKAAYDNALHTFWASMGLPTRHDQERALHVLNQMQSRILDLEEKLAEVAEREAPAKPRKKSNGDAARSS